MGVESLLVLLFVVGPCRQLSALMRVLDPKLILRKYILTAKLASLPINPLLIPAAIPAHMLVAILKIQGHSALTALRESMSLFTLI